MIYKVEEFLNKLDAEESAKNSPDLDKMIRVALDDKTIVYFRKGTSKEKLKERIELYMKKIKSPSNIIIKNK